ncbi:MAG: MCE family protein, partial [Selenomonadaceae bacterium]|nr:MCE family protein [Selenomonadaceae bacterium]
ASLNATMQNVEHISANMDSTLGSPETAKNIAATLTNVKLTSERVERIAKGIEDVVTDPKTKEDLKATIHNARTMTEKADKMLGKVGSIEVTPSVDVMYAGKERDWRTNFNANIAVSDTFFDLGVEGIGEDNKVNAAVGKKLGFITPRAGVLHGKIGAGLGFGSDRFKVMADAYDFNKLRVRLRSEAEIMDDTFFVAEVHNLNKRSERKTYFGLKRNF